MEKRLSGEAVLSPGAVDKNVVPRPQEEKTLKRGPMLQATLCCWSTGLVSAKLLFQFLFEEFVVLFIFHSLAAVVEDGRER